MTDTDEISPFTIFISSSQKEFEELRNNLNEAIESEELFRISGLKMMRAVLIEQKRGEIIPEEIKREIEKSSIYVGIFGKTFSGWTVAEYREARNMGLPLLIYFLKKRRPGRPSRRRPRGRRSEVDKFLENEVKKFGIRTRGPYWNEEDLYDSILKDLVFEIAELVKEATDTRKRIHRSLSPL